MFYSDNPVMDADNYNNYMEERLNMLPKCTCCGYPIQQEEALCIDGNYYCDDCVEDMIVLIGE